MELVYDGISMSSFQGGFIFILFRLEQGNIHELFVRTDGCHLRSALVHCDGGILTVLCFITNFITQLFFSAVHSKTINNT